MSGTRVDVLLTDARDEAASAMVGRLERLAEAAELRWFLHVEVGDDLDADATDWSARLVGADGVAVVRLFDHLSSVGRIERFGFAGLVTVPDADACGRIDAATAELAEKAAQLLATDRPRTHARIAVPGYGAAPVPAEFFTPLADVNAIVLPYDRLDDGSIARPVAHEDGDLFLDHGAAEIASALGLWTAMDGSPLDALRAGGEAGGRVRFLQSRVRRLRTPALPVQALLGSTEQLPLPEGFIPSPGAATEALRLADTLLPEPLTYAPSAAPSVTATSIPLGRLLGMLGVESLYALRDLPLTVWRWIRGGESRLAREAVQRALGRNSRFRIAGVAPDGDDAGEESAVDEVAPADTVLRSVEPIPGEIWVSLVGAALGTVDGDPGCEAVRERVYGDGRVLPVAGRQWLDGLDDLPPAVRGATGLGPVPGAAAVATGTTPPPPTGSPAALPPPSSDAFQRRLDELSRVRGAWEDVVAACAEARASSRVTLRAARVAWVGEDYILLRYDDDAAHHLRRAIAPATRKVLLDALEAVFGRRLDRVTARRASEMGEWWPPVGVAAAAAAVGVAESELLTGVRERAGAATAPDDPIGWVDLSAELDAMRAGASDELRSRILAATEADAAGSGGAEPGRTSDRPEPADPPRRAEVPPQGVLARIRALLREQRERAEADIEDLTREIDRLGASGSGDEDLPRAIPIAVVGGIALLLLTAGLSGTGQRLLQALDLDVVRRDQLFATGMILVAIGAIVLSNFLRRMGGQARTLVLLSGGAVVIASLWLNFGDLRLRVGVSARSSNSLAIWLAVMLVGLVLLAHLQSRDSGDQVRIQGMRLLIAATSLFLLLSLLVLVSYTDSGRAAGAEWSNTQVIALVLGLALLLSGHGSLVLWQFRRARRLDADRVRAAWADDALAVAVDASERLAAADRQWTGSLAPVARLLHRPFGGTEAVEAAVVDVPRGVALKAGIAVLRLTDAGTASLETRLRSQLITPSWLRRQYEQLVQAFQARLARRHGVPVQTMRDRRPEQDTTVPTAEALTSGEGLGDRVEFLRYCQSDEADALLRRVLADLDVLELLRPLLSDPDVLLLDGDDRRADTVVGYFRQVAPEATPTLPSGVSRLVLAAQDPRRAMATHLWWPLELGADWEAEAPGDVVRHGTSMFRQGIAGGAGLTSVRVDVSEPFELGDVLLVAPSVRSRPAAERIEYGEGLGL